MTEDESGAGFGDKDLPNAAGAVATMTGSASPQTLTNIGQRTEGILHFGGPGSFTLTGDPIDLDVTADGFGQLQGLPEIAVDSGSHTVALPITMVRNGILNVATGANLNVTTDLTTDDVSLTKIGGGTATLTNVRTGTAGVAVDSGTLKIAPNGTAAGASNVNTLAIGPTARLDLTDNKLVTNTPVGTFSGGAYNGVQGEVARAYNFGAWDKPGLMTSMPDAGPLVGTTTIGVSNGAAVLFLAPGQTATWAGQTVTDTSTLAMYTYAGDMNFDGLVDGGDYGIIDNFFATPGSNGYANGDLNYDGVIDAGDYGIIDNTFSLQGPPLPTGAGGIAGVAAVPEPTSMLGTAGAIALLALRRRTRRRAE